MARSKKVENRTEKELLVELIDKVDKLTTVMAIQGEFNKSHLKRLSKAGFSQLEIQKATGIDQGDISRELRGVKKVQKKK